MENRLNWIIFLVLAFVIMLGQAYFFSDPPEEVQTQEETALNTAEEAFPSSETTSPEQVDTFSDQEPFEEAQSTPKGNLITIDTPLYKGVIDTAGARFTSWELKDYKASANGEGNELVNLFNGSHPGFNTMFLVKDLKIPEFIPYQYSGANSISLSEGTKELTFRWTSPEGITIKNIFEIDSATYLVKQKFEITNSTGNPIQEKLFVNWLGPIKSGGMTSGVDTNTFVALVSDEVERVNSSPDETEIYKGVINWFGFSEKYFTSTFLPETGAETEIKLGPTSNEGVIKAQFSYPASAIPSGKSSLRTWEVYMGPLESSLLKPVGYDYLWPWIRGLLVYWPQLMTEIVAPGRFS